jgi:predicted  nucleic acid-binding Zn-ribbon protein
VLNPNYNPYDLLEELAIEVQRLNDRQMQLERFLKDLSVQHANIAKHIGTQSNELTNIYREMGNILNEVKQSSSNNSQG